ncbi:triphosphoribosyl-dephospho-CoA synthase [Candidatus Bathyarchaeota archaeon]|nr:triphosphoribosyl-dephospho-CoA synthase [Candidatus Bathyarchaeota archaeon]
MNSSKNLFDHIMRCAQLAAALEASGYPKPGNVHRTSDFKDLHFEDFLASSVAIGPSMRRLAQRGYMAFTGKIQLCGIRIGECIEEAVDESAKWQKGLNAHLGTILLFSPLVTAGGSCGSIEAINPKSLREAVGKVVGQTTRKDAACAFEAMAKMSPQTLGRLPDANAPDVLKRTRGFLPDVTLLEAMKYGATWDSIASEWSTNFERVFTTGYPELIEVFSETQDINTATVHTFLFFLSHFQDTFVSRKAGLKHTVYLDEAIRIGSKETAWVSELAGEALKQGGLMTTYGRASILALDSRLRFHGLNPGTTADMTGASILTAMLCGWCF